MRNHLSLTAPYFTVLWPGPETSLPLSLCWRTYLYTYFNVTNAHHIPHHFLQSVTKGPNISNVNSTIQLLESPQVMTDSDLPRYPVRPLLHLKRSWLKRRASNTLHLSGPTLPCLRLCLLHNTQSQVTQRPIFKCAQCYSIPVMVENVTKQNEVVWVPGAVDSHPSVGSQISIAFLQQFICPHWSIISVQPEVLQKTHPSSLILP